MEAWAVGDFLERIDQAGLLTGSGSESGELCNGDFESDFECWQRGGELSQTIECDDEGCVALLGSPDYECTGGVPVGEARISQSFFVPDMANPVLSLRFRVFSQDLDFDKEKH